MGTLVLRDAIANAKAAEGWSATIYLDTTGNLTIGYGFNLARLILPPGVVARIEPVNSISPFIGESLLVTKMMRVIEEVTYILPAYSSLDYVRQVVLVDMAYNLGPFFLDKTHPKGWPIFIGQVERGEWEAAARNMESTRWYRQVKRRGVRLASMMRTGKDPGQLSTSKPRLLSYRRSR